MKLSADFRRIARNALKGKWVVGVIVGLVAVLLGAGSMNEPELKINIDLSNAGLSFNYAGKTIASTRNGLDSPIGEWIAGNIGWIWLALIALVLIDFVLGSFIGWDILAILTFGVGHLWLTPYKQAAYAAFYREVSGTELPVNDLY